MSEAANPLRRYMRIRGIKGKNKKKFRRELAKNASAKSALVNEQTLEGLVNVQSQGAGPRG